LEELEELIMFKGLIKLVMGFVSLFEEKSRLEA
jgi:hypothetical protein